MHAHILPGYKQDISSTIRIYDTAYLLGMKVNCRFKFQGS